MFCKFDNTIVVINTHLLPHSTNVGEPNVAVYMFVLPKYILSLGFFIFNDSYILQIACTTLTVSKGCLLFYLNHTIDILANCHLLQKYSFSSILTLSINRLIE